jgi:hypothetical protein
MEAGNCPDWTPDERVWRRCPEPRGEPVVVPIAPRFVAPRFVAPRFVVGREASEERTAYRLAKHLPGWTVAFRKTGSSPTAAPSSERAGTIPRRSFTWPFVFHLGS